jgi:hypothetical protein
VPDLLLHSDYTDPVHRPGCLRGISTLTGFGLAVEIGDWHRFSGPGIGAFWVWCRPSIPRVVPLAGLDHHYRE